MAIKINADTSNGLKLTSDTSGIVEIQNAGTTKLTVNSSGATVAGTLAATAVTGDGSGLTGLATGALSTIEKEFGLSSGGSVTAGKGVSLNLADSKVGLLPTLNSLGTETTTNATYSVPSFDRSRWIRSIAISGSNNSRIITLLGNAFTSANPPVYTAGTASITIPFGTPNYDTAFLKSSSYNILAIANDKFLVFANAMTSGTNNQSYQYTKITVVTVDASGNLTKGNVLALDGSSTSAWPAYPQIGFGRLGTSNFFVFAQRADRSTPGSGLNTFGFFSKVIKVSGTTVTATDDTYGVDQFSNYPRVGSDRTKGQQPQSDGDGQNISMIIGSKILRSHPNGASASRAGKNQRWIGVSDFNTSTGAVGSTITFQEVITASGDSISGDGVLWVVVDNTHVMARFPLTDTVNTKYNTYSVNASGVLSLAHSKTVPNTSTIKQFGFDSVTFPNRTSTAGAQVGLYRKDTFLNTISLSATGEILGYNVGLTAGTGRSFNHSWPGYIGSNWIATLNDNGVQKAARVIINAAITGPYTHVGFPKASSSSGDQTIVVGGVATGFTGLTIGAKYYTDTGFTGTVTVSNASNNFVGQAISATEILINRGVS